MKYPEAMRSYPPGSYQKYIHRHFIKDLGFDLSSIGKIVIACKASIDLQNDELIDINLLRKSFNKVIDFLGNTSSTRYDDIVWYKMNLIDQALNEYMSIGSFKLSNDYLKFIQLYFSIERADQGGDTIIVFFDKDFNWAVEFMLSQDHEYLSALVYDSKDRNPKIIDHF